VLLLRQSYLSPISNHPNPFKGGIDILKGVSQQLPQQAQKQAHPSGKIKIKSNNINISLHPPPQKFQL
jgi:hypothetical protein